MDGIKPDTKNDILDSLINTKKLFDIERGKISGETPSNIIALFFEFEDNLDNIILLYQSIKNNNADMAQLRDKDNDNG